MLYSEKYDWKKKQAQCGHKNDRKPVLFLVDYKNFGGKLGILTSVTGPRLKTHQNFVVFFWSIKFSFSVFVMI